MDGLIVEVEKAFQELPEEKLKNIFYTLQKVHEAIILDRGGNDFKVPHFRKERKELVTANIRNISIDAEASRIVDEYLGGIVESTTERESMADLDIDGDRVTEDDLESDSESVEGNVLAAV